MTIHERYSLESWPTGELPLRRLRAWPQAELGNDGWIAAYGNEGASAERLLPVYVDCPPELHLRELREVEIRDPEALLDLVRRVGLPLDPSQPWQGVTGPALLPGLAEPYYQLSINNIAPQAGFDSPDISVAVRPYESVHVAEVAYRVVLARLLVDHMDAALSGRAVAPAWQSLGMLDFSDRDLAVLPEVESMTAEEISWNMFAESLNHGLAVISPRIESPFAPDYHELFFDWFTAAAVLIFNDLALGMPYRTCADETCGRLFKFQVGRAAGGQSRSDAVFCSPQHARNQSQRERRRRERASRREEADRG